MLWVVTRAGEVVQKSSENSSAFLIDKRDEKDMIGGIHVGDLAADIVAREPY